MNGSQSREEKEKEKEEEEQQQEETQQETPEPAPSERRDQQTQTEQEEKDEEEKDEEKEEEEENEQSKSSGSGSDSGYITEEILLTHVARQSIIVADALSDRSEVPLDIADLSRAYELCLFSPRTPPRRQPNGTCEPNPRLNFYPPFVVPEVLATYHIFFQNYKVPLSCRANRSRADQYLALREGDRIPDIAALEEVSKIFEGLGRDEKRAANALRGQNDSDDECQGQSALVELEGDNARLAVLKRTISITHFAYPALNLPPKVMSALMDRLLIRKAEALDSERHGDENDDDDDTGEEGKPAVSDEELASWLGVKVGDVALLEERRKTMMAVLLVTLNLECLRRFFTHPDTMRKLGENLHYLFRHGYVKQASKISNVELSNLVSYMGILHENRLGQNVLHHSLKGETRRDYMRDCVFLFLVYTWQSAMGVWQQCLEPRNVRELEKLLDRQKRALWTGFDERSTAAQLADIVFPARLQEALQNGLPDFVSQSMLQNFRSFILERSGILPAVACALPSDFVPIVYSECPPPLWPYTYLLRLANFLMYHTDVVHDLTGPGLMECHCRCNLCSPHRSLVCNTPLLNETQVIGTFEIQGPESAAAGGAAAGTAAAGLKLTPGMWTSAYLRKFVPEDYHAHEIKFFEHQSGGAKVEPSACVITQAAIVAQLQAIQKARESFLLKKGKGVYLDPHTGEELNTDARSVLGAGDASATGSRQNPTPAPLSLRGPSDSAPAGAPAQPRMGIGAGAGGGGGRVLGRGGGGGGGPGLGRGGGGGGAGGRRQRRGGGGGGGGRGHAAERYSGGRRGSGGHSSSSSSSNGSGSASVSAGQEASTPA